MGGSVSRCGNNKAVAREMCKLTGSICQREVLTSHVWCLPGDFPARNMGGEEYKAEYSSCAMAEGGRGGRQNARISSKRDIWRRRKPPQTRVCGERGRQQEMHSCTLI